MSDYITKPLIQAINEQLLNVYDLIGFGVVVDIGEGDYIPCYITDLVKVPVPKNPDEPDSEFIDTFHVALQAMEAALNVNQYQNTMIYQILPINDQHLCVCCAIMDSELDNDTMTDFE